jgi:protein phosphatase
LPYCPIEDAELLDLLGRGADGAFASPDLFRRAVARIGTRTEVKTTVFASTMSDVGLLRSRNEDSWGWRKLSLTRNLFVVADGMGGHEAGEEASALAARTVCSALAAVDSDDLGALEKATRAAILDANRAVRGLAKSRGIHAGTTVVMALVVGERKLLVCNAGDSRAYLCRAGKAQQLSHDHSLAQTMVEAGTLKPEEVRGHPRASVLTSTVGGEDEDLEVDVKQVACKAGDRILLCSDGLWGVLADDDLAALVGQGAPREAVATLLRAALNAGTKDNVTAQVIEVV